MRRCDRATRVERARAWPSRSLGLAGAPTLVVSLARLLRIGHRGHLHTDLELLVAFDRALASAAILLAPEERELFADLDVGIDNSQRERRALVESYNFV